MNWKLLKESVYMTLLLLLFTATILSVTFGVLTVTTHLTKNLALQVLTLILMFAAFTTTAFYVMDSPPKQSALPTKGGSKRATKALKKLRTKGGT